MTQRQAIRFTRLQLLEQFRASFPEMVHVAENSDEYSSIWEYTSSETEPRAPIFQYPEYDFTVTDAVTNYSDSAD